MKLNLGCVKDIRKGWVNVDKEDFGQDMVFNLEDIPWMWEDSSFDVILMSDCLEHLSSPVEVLKEVYRVAKDGCTLVIRTPHPKSPNMHKDSHHVSVILPNFLRNFNVFPADVVFYSVNKGKPFGLWFLPTFYWNQLAVLLIKKEKNDICNYMYSQ